MKGVEHIAEPAIEPASWWFCDACKKSGHFEVEGSESINSAIRRLTAAHKNASPNCHRGTEAVRLVNHESLFVKGLMQ